MRPITLVIRVPQLNFLIVLLLAGGIAALVGALFGIPSLRIKGLYLAVSTLAAQFFIDWMFARVKWFTDYSSSGSVSTAPIELFGWTIESPVDKYLFVLSIAIVLTLAAKNLVRGHVGRAWMATRDMDVAAEVIGIPPLKAKLSAFAVSSFYAGVAGALWGFVHLGAWEPLAFNINLSLNLLFMIIIGGMGSLLGAYFGAAFILVLPLPVEPGSGLVWCADLDCAGIASGSHDLWQLDRVLSDRRTARARASVGDWQGKVAALAVPALKEVQGGMAFM